MIFKKIIYLLVLFFNTSIYAQVEEQVVLNVIKPENIDKERYNDLTNWALKFDIIPLYTGDYNVNFEYKIVKRLSIEAGLGFTYDFLKIDLSNPIDFNIYEGSDYIEDDYSGSSFGMSKRISLKYYFKSEAKDIKGWYVGFNHIDKTFNYTHETKNDANPIKTHKIKNTVISNNLIFGYQNLINKKVVFDVSLGFGIKDRTKQFVINRRDYYSDYFTVEEGSLNTYNIFLSAKIGIINK